MDFNAVHLNRVLRRTDLGGPIFFQPVRDKNLPKVVEYSSQNPPQGKITLKTLKHFLIQLSAWYLEKKHQQD